MTNDEYMTSKEAAELLGVHRSTIKYLIDEGRLKAIRRTPRPHSHFLILRSSVEEFLRRRREVGSRPRGEGGG